MANDREGLPALFRNAYSLLSDEARAKLRGETAPALTPSDRVRLGHQFKGVRDLMNDGQWRTLGEIFAALGMGFPEASVSARLRDLRHNGRTVERRRRGPSRGLWEYRLDLE